jgi:hypothetical protein
LLADLRVHELQVCERLPLLAKALTFAAGARDDRN